MTVANVRKGALYFNSASGKGIVTVPELKELLEPRGLDLVEIREGIDISEDIRERQTRGERLFIAAGGDGTIHHVIQGLANTDSILGIVPIGTFNHLARDLKLPVEWRAALEIAVAGTERYIDLGDVNGIYFANNISLGLYPDVVLRRERMRENVGKWIAYPVALTGALRHLPKLSMTVEAPPHFEVVKTRLFFVAANSYDLSNRGMIAPRQSLQGGKLAAYWLPESSFGWKLFRELLRYSIGHGAKIEKLRRLHTEGLKVQSPQNELRVGIDGELVKLAPPLKISIAPSGLLVRVERAG